MAERTVFTDSGYRPGRALNPEDYSGGFVDFYKDYLGSTGVRVRDPKDDDDEDKKDTATPNILGTSDDGDDDGVNLLSTVFSNQDLTGGQTYYDAKVDAVDLQVWILVMDRGQIIKKQHKQVINHYSVKTLK